MLYHEFLRLAGVSAESCPLRLYAEYIEPAYMAHDDLFPTKEDVVAYWHAYGPSAFLPDRLALVLQAVSAVRACCYFQSGARQSRTEGLE